LGQLRHVGRRAELALLDGGGQVRLADVGNVAAAAVDRRRFGLVDVEARDVEAMTGELDGERQPDVAESNDAHGRGLVPDSIEQFGVPCGGRAHRADTFSTIPEPTLERRATSASTIISIS